jgi:hypothetical protein
LFHVLLLYWWPASHPALSSLSLDALLVLPLIGWIKDILLELALLDVRPAFSTDPPETAFGVSDNEAGFKTTIAATLARLAVFYLLDIDQAEGLIVIEAVEYGLIHFRLLLSSRLWCRTPDTSA